MLKFIPAVNDLVSLAVREDLYFGDITTSLLLPPAKKAKAVIILEEEGIIAGLELVEIVFQKLGSVIKIKYYTKEGKRETANKKLMEFTGPASDILAGERTALNFLARLSGIATECARYTEQLHGTSARLLDTRKTTPGWRYLDKYAARLGGVINHRFSLGDGILIKDNHLALFSSLGEALKKVRQQAGPLCKIAVEAENEAQVREALKHKADHILLDNRSPKEIKKLVQIINKQAQTEASGGITLTNIREYAVTGVDFISAGELTAKVKFLKMKMEISG